MAVFVFHACCVKAKLRNQAKKQSNSLSKTKDVDDSVTNDDLQQLTRQNFASRVIWLRSAIKDSGLQLFLT